MSAATPLRWRCSWCGDGGPPGPDATDGICAACLAIHFPEPCCEDPRDDGLCCTGAER